MQKSKRRRSSLPNVITLVLYCFVILQTLAVLVVMLNTAAAQRDKNYQNMRASSLQLVNSIESVVQDVSAFDYYYLTDTRFLSIINEDYLESGTHDYAQSQVYIKDLLRKNITLSPHLSGITIYTASGQVYDSTGSSPSYLDRLADIRADMERHGLSSSASLQNAVPIHRQDQWCIVLTKQLKNLYTRRTIGYIHYSVSVADLMELFFKRDRDTSDSRRIFLLTNDQIVHDDVNDGLGQELLHSASYRSEGVPRRFRTKTGTEYLLISTRFPQYDLYIVMLEDSTQLIRQIQDAVLLTVLLNAGVLLIWVLVIASVRRQVRQDSRRIIGYIEQEGYDTPLPDAPLNFSEMDALLQAYHAMRLNLHQVQEREKSVILLKNEMEMKYLEAQINPHFICNALNLITSLATIEGSAMIPEMSANLAHLLYYNLKGDRIVTVRQELEQVRRYMTIQNQRFPGRFNIVFDVPDVMMAQRICRFSLQPIVENAMTHGMEKLQEQVHLWIRGRSKGDTSRIIIENDGVVLPPERVKALNQRILRQEDNILDGGDQENGIGLINVHLRLRREYGSKGGVVLEAREDGRGLRVTVLFANDGKGDDPHARAGG